MRNREERLSELKKRATEGNECAITEQIKNNELVKEEILLHIYKHKYF